LPRDAPGAPASTVANAQTHTPTCELATISKEIVVSDSHSRDTVDGSTDLRPIAGAAASVKPGTLILDPNNGPEAEPIAIRTANASAIVVGSDGAKPGILHRLLSDWTPVTECSRSQARLRDAVLDRRDTTEDERRLAIGVIEWLRSKRDGPQGLDAT